MHKVAAIKPRDFMVAIGMFILVIFATTWMISSAAESNPDFVDQTKLETYNNTFNQFGEYNTQVNSIQNQTSSITGSQGGAFGFLNNLINQGWSTLKALFGSFSFFTQAFNGMATVFGVPTFIPSIFILIMTIVFFTAVLSVIFNRET